MEDEEEGNRGPPKNYSTDSYIISTSTYLPPPFFTMVSGGSPNGTLRDENMLPYFMGIFLIYV